MGAANATLPPLWSTFKVAKLILRFGRLVVLSVGFLGFERVICWYSRLEFPKPPFTPLWNLKTVLTLHTQGAGIYTTTAFLVKNLQLFYRI